MIGYLAFGLSAGLAQVLTNLDNMALLFAILPTIGAARGISAYVSAQVIVLVASLLVAETASEFASASVGYVGVFPIALGLWTLWGRWRAAEDTEPDPSAGGFGLTVLMFLGLSGDSFAVLAPLFVDSSGLYRLSAALGVVAAIAAMAAGAMLLARATDRAETIMRRAEWIGPYVMIAVGLYILANTATDLA